MSIRVDLSPLIAGAVVVGDPGLGVLGSLIPATGEHGPGYAYDDLIAGDETKEIRGLIVTAPTNGTLTAFEDTSFEYDGTSDTFSYQLYVDGVARGSVVTHTINIGSVPVTEPTTFWVVYPASETAPTGAQIVSGLAWAPAVAAGNDTARVDTGSQSFPEVTGLAPGDYRAAFVVYDGSEYSNVDVSAVETVAGVNATATGALDSSSLAAPTGSATGAANAAATGSFASVSLIAPTGGASGSVVVDASATGTLSAASLVAPTGSASAGIVISATATGQIIGIRLDAPTGSASGTGNATADGEIAALMLSAPTGAGTGTQVADATATGLFAPITLAAPTGQADNATPTLNSADIAAIADAVWARAVEGLSAEQIMRIMLAALAGRTAGLGTSTEQYMAQDGVTPRIEATFDANGNRLVVNLNGD